jgi:hypothetical protein
MFIIPYNGIDPYPAKSTLNLSSSYDEPATQLERDSFAELQVVVINIHAKENEELIKRSPYLFGYVEVIRRGREYQAQRKTPEESVAQAIEDCIANGIIADYLRQHASEVIGMLTEQFKLKEALWEIKSKALMEGEQKGRQEGRYEEKLEIAFDMIRDGLPDDMIMKYTGFTRATVK